jgi:multidrug efflux pump subunit AcrA (membrane-fusion protein)
MTRCHFACAGLLFLAFVVSGCGGSDKKPPPAQEKPKNEGDLAFTTLDAKAYKHEEIKSEKIPPKEVSRFLPLTGWVTAKQGHEVTVTAPVAGRVWPAPSYGTPGNGELVFPRPGDVIGKDKDVLVMEPVLAPLESIQKAALQVDIESEVKKAKESEDLAKSEWEQLKKVEALRSKQELQQAEVKYKLAVETLKAAQEKTKLFTISRQTLKAARGGKVTMVLASPGQYVPAATPLITIIDLNPIWLRVSVPEYDLDDVNLEREATVTLKNSSPRPSEDNKPPRAPPKLRGAPLGLVPQVDRDKHVAEILYELVKQDNDDTVFVKDMLVTVHVPLGKGKVRKETVVPNDAIVYDIHGHAWIYVERAKKGDMHVFQRRPVQLGAEVEGGVIVWPTLSKDDLVVTSGAEYIFSREFFSTPVATEK